MRSPASPLFRVLRWLLAAAVVVAVCLLRWGGGLLIASDQPKHVDAVVVLQGSIIAEKVRIAGAINLLKQGVADRALLSVPKESYWGQSITPIARSYLERNYGSELAARVDFCETSGEVNSTLQELPAVRYCIQERHWQSVAIVTSNYHTRRVGVLWRRMNGPNPNIQMWVEGVSDPEFQQPWWRHRQSAKIWVMEVTKLAWTLLGG